MAVRNLSVAYAPGSTVVQILNALKDAFVSEGAFAGTGLGFTELEDSISGNSLFVVQCQLPAEPLSRMIIEARYSTAPGWDAIAFVVWDQWTPGAPGSGNEQVQSTDPGGSYAPTQDPAYRYHRIDLTNGGTFYLDGDDATGLYCAIHSERGVGPTRNPVQHLISVCSIQKSAAQGNFGPNYGVMHWAETTTYNFLGGDGWDVQCSLWVPPKTHEGFGNGVQGWLQAASRGMNYLAMPPNVGWNTWGGESSVSGRTQTDPDTYNNAEILLPIFIGNFSYHRGSNTNWTTPVGGRPMGYRGIMNGIYAYAGGNPVPWRTAITDPDTGNEFYVYSINGADGGWPPKYAVPKA
jgi:hypothetical protein